MQFLNKKIRILIAILLFISLPFDFIFLVRTNKSIILPGGLEKVDDLIEIDSSYEQKGSFNSIFVMDLDNETIFQSLITKGESNNTYVSETHLSSKELSYISKCDHEMSIKYSLINAYKLANKNLIKSFNGLIIRYYSKDIKSLKAGDLVYQINDVSYLEEEKFKDSFKNQHIGDTFYILRDNQKLEVKIDETMLNDEKRVIYYNYYYDYLIDYDASSPKIKIHMSTSGGPSGGLLQTLNSINKLLEEDITHGMKITGTGTINLDGSVGEIGGIEQKIITANNNHADLFFCPKGNYEDALKQYNKIKNPSFRLVMVSNVSDALKVLNEYE